MTQYASLLSVDLPQLYLWNKYAVFISCSYLETELFTANEYFAHKSAQARTSERGRTQRVLLLRKAALKMRNGLIEHFDVMLIDR